MASHSSAGSSDLGAGLRQALPGVDGSTMDELLLCLGRLGVTSMADLEYVRPESITPPLTEVQSRKLLKSFSESVTQRELFTLQQQDQKLRALELKKDIQVQRMTYSTEKIKVRLDANKTMLDEHNKMVERVERGVDKEDEMYQSGASSIGKGVGGAAGMYFGGIGGGALGAATGEFVGKGIASLTTAATRETRIQERLERESEQLAIRMEGLKQLESELARDDGEGSGRALPAAGDLNQLTIEYN